jgi:hypothetical protein
MIFLPYGAAAHIAKLDLLAISLLDNLLLMCFGVNHLYVTAVFP